MGGQGIVRFLFGSLMVKNLFRILSIMKIDGQTFSGKFCGQTDKRPLAAGLETGFYGIVHQVKKYTAQICDLYGKFIRQKYFIGNLNMILFCPKFLSLQNRLYQVILTIRMKTFLLKSLAETVKVSGRSKITDFEEIVRLDTEYIEKWSIGLDIKILVKTVGVLFRKDGAM